MRQKLLWLVILAACEDGNTLSKMATCPNGAMVDTLDHCNSDEPTTVTVIQTACSDGRIVASAHDCIESPITNTTTVTITTTVTVTVHEQQCLNGQVIPAEQSCPPTFGCFDGSIVLDPITCPQQVLDCPEGMTLVDGACLCANPGRYAFENGITIDCPAPQTIVTHDYICWDRAMVTDPLLCSVQPPQIVTNPVYLCLEHGTVRVVADSSDCAISSACPVGTRTVGETCECPEGGTVTLDNGRVLTCPRYELPDACNWLQVTDLMPDVLTIGRRLIGPTAEFPIVWLSILPLIQFSLNTCEGQELSLGGTVFTGTVSLELADMYTDTTVTTVGRKYQIQGLTTVHPSGLFTPNFLFNSSYAQDGTFQSGVTISGREVKVEVKWQNQLEPGTYTIVLRGFQATRKSDGAVIVPQTPVVLRKTVVVSDDPCAWTYAPDTYSGDPRYLPSASQQIIGPDVWDIGLAPVTLRACTPTSVDVVQHYVWAGGDINRWPQIQHDLSGIWWGTQNDPVITDATYTVTSNLAPPATYGGVWYDDNEYVDARRWVQIPFNGRVLLPGEDLTFTPELTVNPLHPRSMGVSDIYFFYMRWIGGNRIDNGAQSTSILMNPEDGFYLSL